MDTNRIDETIEELLSMRLALPNTPESESKKYYIDKAVNALRKIRIKLKDPNHKSEDLFEDAWVFIVAVIEGDLF